jgi:hypothetical protein
MTDVNEPSKWQSLKYNVFLVGSLLAFVLFCGSVYVAFAWPHSWGLVIVALGILSFFLTRTLYNASHPKLARLARIHRNQAKASRQRLRSDGISRAAFYAGFAIIRLPIVFALLPTLLFPKDYFRSYAEVDAYFRILDEIEWFALPIGAAISVLVPIARQLYLVRRDHG